MSQLPPTTAIAALRISRPLWREYLELTKPRVVALMLFTVLVGMLLATDAVVPWRVLLFGTVGIALVAGAAAAVNHLVDRRIDAIMARTRARPLPMGTLSRTQVAVFAATLGLAGMALLLNFTNPLCALLTLASLLGYAVIYSMYLKHATPQNIVIGGAAGAAPPHFWALAIHRRAEYARADVPMLPVTHGVDFTTRRIVIYTVALLGISLLPTWIGMSGLLYLAGVLPLGLRFVWMAIKLRRSTDWAMPTFRYSIVYLFGLFGFALADHFLI